MKIAWIEDNDDDAEDFRCESEFVTYCTIQYMQGKEGRQVE